MQTIRGPIKDFQKLVNGVIINFDNEIQLKFMILEHDLLQVRIGNPKTEENKSWMVVDSSGDVPWNGREKSDYSRFTNPKMEFFSFTSDLFQIETLVLKIEIHTKQDLKIECFKKSDNKLFFSDINFDAYRYGKEGFRHTLLRLPNEEYYGFGEVSGVLKKNNERLRIDAKDSMGYDAEKTDPLYKHWPYHLTIIDSICCYGLLYDTYRRSVFDLGKEISAFRGSYRYFETARSEKGLDYYLFMGNEPIEISKRLIQLIGSPVVPPDWALGYLGSSMAYTESENAMERLDEYLTKLKTEEIPCDGFHLSSGYTTDKCGRRCVFTWNYSRIPDPKVMFKHFNDANVPIIANVKPWLLKEHPKFEQVKSGDGYFINQDGKPSYGRFWVGDAGTSGLGCYLDFSNEFTRNWWKTNVKKELLDLGCVALWNDNNEYEVDDGDAISSLKDSVEESGRALQTLLMARTSYEALTENNSNSILVISRSGSIGTHRYSAQTWSGDNSTSFKTLKYNICMCLGLGLCGWVGSGPDIGGFAGEKPTKELFWRWLQCGLFLPRFSIHSSIWKTHSEKDLKPDAAVTNEPWMFPDILSDVRNLIRMRCRLRVLLFSLHLEANMNGAPIARPLLFHYFHDVNDRKENFEFMLGNNLLIAPIVESGVEKVYSVYFPGKGEVWYDISNLLFFQGGKKYDVEVSLPQTEFLGVPLFLREGGGFVLSGTEFLGNQHVGLNRRIVYIALGESNSSFSWYEKNDWMFECRFSEKEIKIFGKQILIKNPKMVREQIPFECKVEVKKFTRLKGHSLNVTTTLVEVEVI